MPSIKPAMKVVQLGPYSPPHGGVRANVVAIRNALCARAIPSVTINLTRYRGAATGDIYYPKSALAVLWLLLRSRCDVIHLHLGGMLTLRELALAAFCGLIPWGKKVLTYHSGGYPSSKEGLSAHRWTLRGAVFRRFDAIIAVNDAIARLFVSFGVPAARIHAIAPYVLVPPPQATALPRHIDDFLERHRPIFVTVGLLEPEYNLSLQLDAFTLIRGRFAGAGLVIVGEGSLHEALAAEIERHPYAGDILLCGDVAHDATLQIIATSDALLRTTKYDGDAIAIREALYLGTPVIATDNGMRPDGVHLISAEAGEVSKAAEEILAQPRVRTAPTVPDLQNVDAVVNLYRSLVSPKEQRGLGRADASPHT